MTDRSEALKMACQDSELMVSPQARQRGMEALKGDDSPEAQAAMVIFIDGGSQQGLPGFYSYQHSLDDWVKARDILKGWWRTQDEHELEWLDDWANRP